MTTMASFPDFPSLPLVCLSTANDLTTVDAIRGKNTVIDLWTTRCTQCPAALDKLNTMAGDSCYEDVQFISICCDKLDGAREIIEKEEETRWRNVAHYYMSHDNKEKLKKIFGFQAVPFYVMVNEQGEITQMDNKVDFDLVPGMKREEKENEMEGFVDIEKTVAADERVFVLDELDF